GKDGWAVHTGLDLNFGGGDADLGMNVYAMASGAVEFAANTGAGFGNVLVLRHDNGVWSRYCHLQGFGPGVKPGAHVDRGQLVAHVGKTGGTTWAHLHFDILHTRPPANRGGWCNWPGADRAQVHAYYLDPATWLIQHGCKPMVVQLG
ncbi:MAG TPA: M23 family metallopeptidase, partial [Deinococcales bacterium]|nr:M23 family metallopeptidase [Deinococcales bacterium]